MDMVIGLPKMLAAKGGYIEFLEMIKNPKHADSKLMKAWYDVQCYKYLNIDLINRRLKCIR